MNDTTNPYESPRTESLEDLGEAADGSDASLLRAFVGPNANYYLRRWAPLLSGSPGGAGFNWAAFFLSGFWLPYRKMYMFAGILFGIIFLESIAEVVVFQAILGRPEPPAGLQNIFGIVLAAFCGGYGNRWYYRHAKEQVAQLRGEGLQDDALSRELKSRGGTSLASSLGLFVLFTAAMIVAFMVLDIFLESLLDRSVL